MNIVYLYSGPNLDGDALIKGPLGGTETALIGVTRELAKIAGNVVHLFTNTDKPGIYEGVVYHKVSEFAAWAAANICDVLISLRHWLPFWVPVKSRVRIYFSPDSYDQPLVRAGLEAQVTCEGKNLKVNFFPPAYFMDRLDAVFCVGQWQAKMFVEKLGMPSEKIFVTANGHFPEAFQPLALAQREAKLVYTSTPFRGLSYLLDMFPAIRERVPAAQLEICSGMGVYGVAPGEDQASYGDLYEKIRQLGGHSHGSIKQAALAKILCQSLVFAYPNTFEETFCIAALEAQAAGLPIVTSKKAALMERVSDGIDGFLISGEPGTEAYNKAFVEAVAQLMTNPILWQRFSTAGQQKAKNYTYEVIAKKWQTYFLEKLADREARLPEPLKLAPIRLKHPELTTDVIFDDALQLNLIRQFTASFGF